MESGVRLSITRAESAADFESVAAILVDAALRMIELGQPMWRPEDLTGEKILGLSGASRIYLGWIDGIAVATVRLQWEDRLFWPDLPGGDSGFVHKLAVCRAVAGRGVAAKMLEHAATEARGAGKRYLRLDCAPRPKLCRVYEAAGFEVHSEIRVGPSLCRRYQKSL